MKSELVKPAHLARKAVVYIRQSTPHQVVSNQESLRLQYALCQRARELAELVDEMRLIEVSELVSQIRVPLLASETHHATEPHHAREHLRRQAHVFRK